MRVFNFRFLPGIFLLILLCTQAKAQVAGSGVNLLTRAQDTMKVCLGPSEFRVELNNTSGAALTNVSLFPRLQEGIEFITGSAAVVSGTGVSITSQSVGADLRFPTIVLNTLPTGVTVISYQARGNCNVISKLVLGKTNNQTRIEFVSNSISYFIDEPNGSESFNVIYPQMEPFVTASEITTDKNKPEQRSLTLRNSGLGGAAQVRLLIDYSTSISHVSLLLGSVSLTPVSTSGTIREYLLDLNDPAIKALVGNGNGLLDQNESIVLTENVKATSCGRLGTQYTVLWGCATLAAPTANQSCNQGQQNAITNAYLNITDGEPTLVTSRTITQATNYCGTTTARLEYSYTNNGNGNSPASVDGARNISLLLNNDASFIISNFQVKNSSGTWVPIAGAPAYASSTQILYNLGGNTGTPLTDQSFDGILDDLPVGATLEIAYEVSVPCLPEFNNFFTSLYKGLSLSFNYTDNCGAGKSNLNSYLLENTYVSSKIDGPPDLTAAQSEHYFFTSHWNTQGLELLDCSQGNFFSTLQVPAGYKAISASWNGSAVSFSQAQPGADVTLTGGGYDGAYDVEFELECDTVNQNNNPSNPIVWSMFHRCNNTCASCVQKLVTGSYEVFNHCPACTGMRTTRMEVERTTFGQVPSGTGYYSHAGLATAIAVNRGTPGIKLDAVYEMDNVLVLAKGKLDAAAIGTTYAFNKVHYRITYALPGASVNPLAYQSAVFRVYKSGVVQNYTVSTAPVVTGSPSTGYSYDFTLPGSGTLEPGDSVHLDATFQMQRIDNFTPGEYKFTNFRANFYGVEPDDDEQNCETYGDAFSFYKTKVEHFPSVGSNWGCNGEPILAALRDYSATGGDDFPNEYRATGYFESITVKIPVGYRYVPASSQLQYLINGFGFPKILADPFNTAVVTPNATGDLITITKKSDWLIPDQVNGWGGLNLFALLYIDIEPKCAIGPVCSPAPNYASPFYTPVPSIISTSASGTYTIDAHAPGSELLKPFTFSGSLFNRRNAVLNLSASGIKDGYQKSVSWPVQICNNTSGNQSTADNVWVSFEPENPSTRPLTVKDMDNGGLDIPAASIVRYGSTSPSKPYMMVQVGTIPLNQCRNLEFSVRYNNCQENVIDNIHVTSGWSCRSARTPQVTSSYAGKICDRITDCEQAVKTGLLQLRYKNAGYQWTVNRLGPNKVNLCENIPFEIKLTSALTADMSDIDVWFDLPPGLSFVSNSGTYVYNGISYPLGNPLLVAGRLPASNVGWKVVNLDFFQATLLNNAFYAPPLNLIALPGTRLLGQNDVLLQFNLRASCTVDLDAGSPINFYTEGVTNCDDTIPLQQQRKIQLLDDPDSISVNISSTAFTGCQGNNTISVALRNELTRVTQAEVFTVVLPAEVSYVGPTLFTGVLNSLGLGEPTITGKTLQWNLPSGLAVGNLGMVIFPTKLDNDQPAGGKVLYTARTKMNGNATCVTDLSTCPLVMTTGLDTDTLPVSFPKPIAKITASMDKDSICLGKQTDLVASMTYADATPVGAYTCTWISGNVNPAVNCTVTVTPTATSTYQVILEDANHCKDTATKVITVLPLPSIVEVEVNGTTCKEKYDGTIKVEASTSSASVSVALTLKLGNVVVATAMTLNGSQHTFTGLDEGDYTVEVHDTLTGCVQSIPVNVPYDGPRIESLCSSSVPCNKTVSQVIFRIRALRPYSNNQGDYTFRLLLNGTPVPIALDPQDLPTLLTYYASFDPDQEDIFISASQSPGSYVFELTDDSGCVITYPLVIPKLEFFASVNKPSIELCYATEKRDVPVYVSHNEACVPLTDVAYQYQLFKFDKPLQAYQPLTGLITTTQGIYTFASLDTGSYKVVVSGAATGVTGCKDSLFFEMTYKSTFYLDTIIPKAPLCHNTATGSACVVVKGGAGEISYQWIDPVTGNVVSTEACANGLEGGKTYTLLVTDENGCADPQSYPVTIPAGPPRLGPPIVKTIDTACSATAEPFDVNIGAPPFQFDWHKIDTLKSSTGADSLIRNRSVFYDSPEGPDYVSTKKPIKKGYYRIYIIDANGCRDSVDHYFGRPKVAMQIAVCMNWTTYTGVGPKTPTPPVYVEPTFPVPVIDMLAFNEKVQECVDRQVSIAREQFVQLCQTGKSLDDQLTISYNNKYEHITLYYYDRGGRLVKTVPPAGVALVNPPNGTATPAHTLVTTYEYNSLNQLTTQNTPDAGRTDFVNNDKGQLRYSQNARQALDNTYSYTNYDNLGRIQEVGQDNLVGSLTSLDPLASQLSATRHENTQTVYTQPATGIHYNGKAQRFLRNRVSYTYTLNQNGDREYTYYSYDPHGNVEWLLQEIQGFSRTSVAYEYDLISNKVVQAKFNEGRKDQFFHRYSYDEDNRITSAETSRDGIVWDKDVSYNYYLHGPMKRTALGEDRVQGMDYAYTVQGWLKGINSPDLQTNEDLGGDGTNATSGFPQDQFGMSLGYFNGDYTATNAFSSSSYQMPGTKNLYNGNISSWSDKIGFDAGGNQYGNTLTGNRYTYDKLNRIRTSEFGSFNSSWTMQAGTTGAYYTSYTYDPNGNLQSLKRNAYGSSTAMDSLTYNYIGGTNKLDHVDEQVTGAQNGLMQDITDQELGNYGYDAIGNLTKDTAEHIHVKWNVYGKVTEVVPDKMLSDQKPHLKFSYDASGNRTKKQVNRAPYFQGSSFKDTIADPATVEITYYSRDASGTVMGIYERTHQAIVGKPGYYNAVYILKELPMYGSSRLGQIQLYDTIAVKVFKREDFDKVNFLMDGLERHSTLHNPIVAGYSEVLFDTLVVNQATVHTYPVPGVLSTAKVDFLGTTGNNLAVGEDSSGARALEFYTITAETYWGKENVNLVYDNTNRLMKGLDTNSVDAEAKNVIVKQPGTNKNYYLFTRDTLGNLIYHKVNMNAIGYGTTGIPSGEITAHTTLNGSGYGRHMAVVEDYVNNVSLVYVTTHDTSLHKTTLLQLQIDEMGGIVLLPIYTYDSYDEFGEGEIQIAPDGSSLAIYNHKKAFGFFNHRNVEVITLALDASYKPLDQASPKVYSYPYSNYPKGSVELSSTGEHVYFEQVSLVNFINGTGNKAVYRQNLVESILDTLALQSGDLRRSESNYLYSFYNNQSEQNAWKDTLFFSTSPTVTNVTDTLKGYLAYQPHKVLLKKYHDQIVYRKVGDKLYELNDHLGNVRVVITDVKQPSVQAGLIVGLMADVSSYNNFYAFGMQQPGRTYAGVGAYRYGFNGMEKDDEIKGSGNSYDFGARIYDPRIGRWLAVDSRQDIYVPIAPYAFAINNPIIFIDKDGNVIYDSKGNKVEIKFNTETGEITEIKGTEDARLINLIKNTYSNSAKGKATIEKINSSKIRYNINVHEKRGIFQNEKGKYGEVEGLSAPTDDKSNIYIDVYGDGTDNLSVISESDLAGLEIVNIKGRTIKLEKLSPEAKEQIVNDVNKRIGQKTHAAHNKSYEGLTEEESKNYSESQKAGDNNALLRSAYTLIYEVDNATERTNHDDVNSEEAQIAGETAGKKGTAEAHKQNKAK